MSQLNTLRPRQNGRHFADAIFKWIFLNENVWISLKVSLKFVPMSPVNNIPSLVQIMALRRPGDKPLSEPMVINLLTHICVTRPQWVNQICCNGSAVWETKFLELWPDNAPSLYIYMFYIKLHHPWSTFYLPSSKFTCIGKQARVSFPHWSEYRPKKGCGHV